MKEGASLFNATSCNLQCKKEQIAFVLQIENWTDDSTAHDKRFFACFVGRFELFLVSGNFQFLSLVHFLLAAWGGGDGGKRSVFFCVPISKFNLLQASSLVFFHCTLHNLSSSALIKKAVSKKRRKFHHSEFFCRSHKTVT